MGRNEGIDLRLGRRQARQVVTQTPNQCLRLCGRAAREFLRVQFGVDEAVDIGVLEFLGQRLE